MPSGKKQGKYFGKVAVRSSGSLTSLQKMELSGYRIQALQSCSKEQMAMPIFTKGASGFLSDPKGQSFHR